MKTAEDIFRVEYFVEEYKRHLQHLEKESRLEDQKEKIREVPKSNLQLTLFDAPDPKLEKIRLQLEALDINSLTPMEALLRLNEWKSMLR